MPIEPVDPKAFWELVAAAKSSWQWLASGIAGGIYGVWKYINRRIEKVESAILEHQKTLVTSTELSRHTDEEDAKFKELFQQTREMNSQLSQVIGHLEEIGKNLNTFRERQLINEAKIAESAQDIAAIKERHRLEEK